MQLNVAVWGTGGVGSHAIRAIARRPDLNLVGVWVHSPEKVGTDAGTPGNHHGELLVHGAQLRNRLGDRVHCLRPLLQIFAWYELLRLHLLRRQRHVNDDLVDESATNT